MSHFKTAFFSSITTILIISIVLVYFYYTGNKGEIFPKENSTEIAANIKTAKFDQLRDSNNAITQGRQTIITNTVKDVSPAVVGISVTEIRTYSSPLSNDPFWGRFYRPYSKKVKGLGSGTIISPDGYILTNDHVAGNATEIIVTLTDGTQYDAEVVGTDVISDICLLKIDAENLPYLYMGDSDDILIGEWVIALGNPFGLFAINDKPTVTVGVVSSIGMNIGAVQGHYYLSMIQTDAAINGGNSGGPLVNSLGEIIGMNTLIYTAQGSGGNVGVGFAIPINKVKNIVSELKTRGEIKRDYWTGIHIQGIDQEIAEYYNLPNTRGVIITHISKNSPADKAGLEVGDVILKAGGYAINDDESLIGVMYEFRTDDEVDLEILRGNKELTKHMKLESRND